MEHQTVCLVARKAEREGICTVVVGSGYDILECLKPPRAVFTDFPTPGGILKVTLHIGFRLRYCFFMAIVPSFANLS